MINPAHDLNFLREVLLVLLVAQQFLTADGLDGSKDCGIGSVVGFPDAGEGTGTNLVFDDVI